MNRRFLTATLDLSEATALIGRSRFDQMVMSTDIAMQVAEVFGRQFAVTFDAAVAEAVSYALTAAQIAAKEVMSPIEPPVSIPLSEPVPPAIPQTEPVVSPAAAYADYLRRSGQAVPPWPGPPSGDTLAAGATTVSGEIAT